MAKPLPPESIARTQFGVLPDFSSLFSGVRYVPYFVTPGNGAHSKFAPGEIFLSTGRYDGCPEWVPDSSPAGFSLACTPAEKVWKQGIAGGSIKLTPWKDQEHFLVTFEMGPHYVGSVWLAFVPYAAAFDVEPLKT